MKLEKSIIDDFEDVLIIEYYDGVTTGVIKKKNGQELYLLNMCYFSPESNLRIFSVVQVSEAWLSQLRKGIMENERGEIINYEFVNSTIKQYYLKYPHNGFLLMEDRARNNFRIIEIEKSYLKFYEQIEETIALKGNQNSEWLRFFK